MSVFKRIFGDSFDDPNDSRSKKSKGASSDAQGKKAKKPFLFTESERASYLRARDNLRYLPVGPLSEAAETAQCERQYAHQIVFSSAPFTEQSAKARAIWINLKGIVKKHPDLKANKEIIQTLEKGEEVMVKMPSHKARFFERKLKKLGIQVEVLKKPTTPITYTFIPTKQAA